MFRRICCLVVFMALLFSVTCAYGVTLHSQGRTNHLEGTLITNDLLGKDLHVVDEVGGWWMWTAEEDCNLIMEVNPSGMACDSFSIRVYRSTGGDEVSQTNRFTVGTGGGNQKFTVENVKAGETIYWWDDDDSGRAWTLRVPFTLRLNTEKAKDDSDPETKMKNRVNEIENGLFRAYEQDTQYTKDVYKKNAEKPEFSGEFSSMKYGDSTVGIAACGLFALMNIEHYDNDETYTVEDVRQIIINMGGKTTNKAGLSFVADCTDKINYVVSVNWEDKYNTKAEDRSSHIDRMQEWLGESGQYAIISVYNSSIRNATTDGWHFMAVLAYDQENDRYLIADSAAMYLSQNYTYDRILASDDTVTGYAWITTDDLLGYKHLSINLMEKQD